MQSVSSSHGRLPWYKKVVRETKRIGHQAEGVVHKGLDQRVELISEITASVVFGCVIGKVAHAGAEKLAAVVFDMANLLHGYDLVDAIAQSDF